jgi:hypothetical protein
MPRGDKSSYSSKQKRQAEHIEDSSLRNRDSKQALGSRLPARVRNA